MGQASNWLANLLASLRPVFHWQYAGVVIPLLWGAAITIGGIGLTLDDPEHIHITFMLAYAALSAGFVFSIGFWVNSNFVEALRSKARWARKPQKKKETKRRYLVWQYSVIAGVCVLFAILMYQGARIETAKRLRLFTGTLVPANDPFIPACNGASDNEAIILALLWQILGVDRRDWIPESRFQ